mmetsp:Transcript_30963/g.45500  ORF Transcript_30963/g.45500 Transcript_30963/m.45500 type:complete len:109 (+) Transcript_30963:1514-1840(+)
MVGAGGKTYLISDRRGRRDGRTDRREDHPAGVSPSPWRKTSAPGLSHAFAEAEVEKADAAVTILFLPLILLVDRLRMRTIKVVIGRIEEPKMVTACGLCLLTPFCLAK